MDIGFELYKARLNRDISQTDLAKKSGVSQNTLSRIEHKKIIPSYRIMEKIAKALDLELIVELVEKKDTP